MGVQVGATEVSGIQAGAADLLRRQVGPQTVWPEVTPPTGPLVARWTFEGPQPEVDIVGGRALTLGSNTDVQTISGRSALAAPTTAGSAVTPDGFLNLAGFSIAMWVWTPSASSGGITTSSAEFRAGGTVVAQLYAGWREITGSIYELNRVMVVTDTGAYNRTDQSTNLGSVIPPQEWRHVLATYDGATLALYVNGTVQITGAKTGVVTDPDSFSLAVVATSAVTDVGIWDRALTAQEVLDVYNGTAAP